MWTNPKTGAPLKSRRGPKKWSYTYDKIAEALGMKPQSVRAAASRGDFDPDDLVSLGNWIALKARRLDRQVPEVKPEVQAEDCACPSKPLGAYSAVNKCFFCLDCGLVTRRI